MNLIEVVNNRFGILGQNKKLTNRGCGDLKRERLCLRLLKVKINDKLFGNNLGTDEIPKTITSLCR